MYKFSVDFIPTKDIFFYFDENIFEKVRKMEIPHGWKKSEFKKIRQATPNMLYLYKTYKHNAPIFFAIGIFKNEQSMMVRAMIKWLLKPDTTFKASKCFPATVKGFKQACKWLDIKRQEYIQIIANGKI